MASNVRAFPQVMPPSPQQQDWVWNGTSWCDPCCPPPGPMPPPCPPAGWPTPCPPWFPPPAGQAPWYPGANGGVSFSATPPANPIRGNFWWDGIMLHLFDGAAWVDIGPGATGTPGVPGATGTTTITFAMQQPTPLAVSATAWTIVPYSASPQTDIQTAWNATSYKLTPKVAGNYLFEVRAISPGSGNSAIAIVKNDSGSFTSFASSDIVVGVANNTTMNTWMTAIGIANMNGSTDFVRVWGFAIGASFPAGGSSPVYSAVLLP